MSELRTNRIVPRDGLPSGSAGGIVQIKQTTVTSSQTFSVAVGGTSSDVISVSITPTRSDNKILVMVSLNVGCQLDEGVYMTLFKGGSAVTAATGDADGSRQRVTSGSFIYNTNRTTELNKTFLDSPATTSSITYSCRIGGSYNGTTNYYLNRDHNNDDNNRRGRGMSTITVMEISA